MQLLISIDVIFRAPSQSMRAYLVLVNYTAHYSLGANKTVPASFIDDVCDCMFQVPPTVCPPSNDVSMVNVSAANRLGSRQPLV